MMSLIRPIILAGLTMILAGCAGVENPHIAKTYAGPTLVSAEGAIPGVSSAVESADYWIGRAANPDSLLMTPERVARFNRENPVRKTMMADVLSLPLRSPGGMTRANLDASARYLMTARFSVTSDIPLEAAERRRIVALMDTAGVPDSISVRFGVVLHRVSGKLWPTDIPVMSDPGDNEFDQGMVATLDLGDPVALLHTSKDDLWCYVQSENFTCWVPATSVAFGDSATVRTLTDSSAPLVAVGSRVPIYGAPEDGPAIGYLNMGTYLPIRSAGTEFYTVLVPGRGMKNELVAHPGYVRLGPDVSIGFLPYTLRNVYRQCFSLLGHRYGWGGIYDTRDCSGYVLDVFRCFGIRLPRNSANQAKASAWRVPLAAMPRDARLDSIQAVPGGITLLQLPGHIMIYLGQADGTPYVIHNFWAWREDGGGVDVAHRAARVAVTNLMLGEGSTRGAFIDRLANITVLGQR